MFNGMSNLITVVCNKLFHVPIDFKFLEKKFGNKPFIYRFSKSCGNIYWLPSIDFCNKQLYLWCEIWKNFMVTFFKIFLFLFYSFFTHDNWFSEPDQRILPCLIWGFCDNSWWLSAMGYCQKELILYFTEFLDQFQFFYCF